jgi:rSAM/selenodomain-associated transferase 2
MRFSVIIPTLNEAVRLAETLGRARAALPGAEFIVADGGSADGTMEIARAAGATVVAAARGRGRQLAAGAAAARGELLLFLHADTLLPGDAGAVLARAFADGRTEIGTFRLDFDAGGRFLRACARCSRYDSVFTRFGDQGIVVRRKFYGQIGGFPEWPLFEDVELLRRARRLTRIVSFPACVTTSARRFRRIGALRQQLRNAWLLLRFLAGASPHRLAGEYPAEPPVRPFL